LTHNRDISERKRMEEEIEEGRRRLNEAMEHMADGLAMFDKDARLVLCNDQYRTMFPQTAALRVPGARLEDILRASVERGEQTDISRDTIEAWIQHVRATFTEPGETDIQLAGDRWIRARVRPTADGGSLTLMTDVTQIKHAEAVMTEHNRRLMNLASEDGLTGLANRRAYDIALPRAFAQCRRDGKPLSLLLIDVDRFKAYNDTYGHPAGDRCLRTIGNLLKMSLKRPSDVGARYGGEEFAAILPNTPEEGAMQLAESLRKTILSLGIEHARAKTGVLTISIGVATMDPDNEIGRLEELTAQADAALYAAKAGGRNRSVAADQKRPLAATG
jgi:diguanylate cyclase (GGDEF)-like protein